MSVRVVWPSIALVFACAGVARSGMAQAPAPADTIAGQADWNAPRARRLIERAIARRAEQTGATELRDYQAHARGHIYFLFDVGRGTERHMVKADQMALNLYWLAPGRTRQVIVGHRDKKALPTSIRYHIDHLTVVMDNFGDRISLGEGSEVRDATHPAARGALEFYQYRVADSLTLQLGQRRVSVHKIEIRPRDPDGPGLVGAIYLDRDSADIVRMDFTFTAASYLDDQLDYINVRLENALWEGQYWLPYRQGIELRRELRWLQFPAGGIIRAEFTIGDYRFNTGVPDALFRGPSVVYAPLRARQRFEFDQGLYDALDPSVAVTPPSMEAIRREATRIVARSYLQSAQNIRLAVPGVSSVVRFRRAQGLYVGPGLDRTFKSGHRAQVLGGWTLGSDRAQLIASLSAPLSSTSELRIAAYRHRPVDVSPWPASSGTVGSLAALVGGEDFRDEYWTSGGSLSVFRRVDSARLGLSASWERHESAALAADDLIARGYRAVRAVDDGEIAFLTLQAGSPPVGAAFDVGGTRWEVRLEAASRSIAGDFDYVHAAARGEHVWVQAESGFRYKLAGAVAAAAGDRLPAQRVIPAGGRGTVRGYGFHDFVGNLYGGLAAELSRDVVHPFLSVALFADVAWVGIEGEGARRAVAAWNEGATPAGASRGLLVGVGAGVGVLYDILRVGLARGVREGGIWELVVRIRPELWEWL